MADAVASFMLQDLRRFQMYDSSATRPYAVSAIGNYKRAAGLGYISLDADGKARTRLQGHWTGNVAPDFAGCGWAF